MYEYFELHILRKLPIECFDKMVTEAGADLQKYTH